MKLIKINSKESRFNDYCVWQRASGFWYFGTIDTFGPVPCGPAFFTKWGAMRGLKQYIRRKEKENITYFRVDKTSDT